MEAKELRIGNYYDHSGKIEMATPNVIREVWESKRIWCKPIPLTEEWLFKFGYTRFHKNNWSLTGDSDRLWINSYHPDIILNINSECLCKCKYVHQLQNLYFALTGEELTTPY